MKISIVISTYNGEKYIEALMKSLLQQSRQADEVLFFDDKSKDCTIDLITKFITKNRLETSWHVVVNQKNKGWKRNFMEGMWKASGDLVFPCDQDDIWCKNKLEEMEKIMKLYPEIKVLTSNYEAFYDSGKTVIGPVDNDRKIVRQKIAKNALETKYPGCTYCIRKEMIELSKKYWEKDFPHDALFWRMGIFSDSLYSYNESLIKWRKHDDSTYAVESLQAKSREKKIIWFEYAFRVIKSLERYILNQKVENRDEKEKLLKLNYKWVETRKLFYDTKNIIYWFKLIKYRKCYDRFKQFIGDLYLVYVKNS